MNICLFISKIERLRRMEEAVRLLSDETSECAVGRENRVNQLSLRRLEDIAGGPVSFDSARVYFGVETCERLLPKKEDIHLAAEICSLKGSPLSVVLPYLGPSGVRAVREFIPELGRIVDDHGPMEVVVNDIAGLSLISGCGIQGVEPVLGRLFSKAKRDPRFFPEELPVLKGSTEVMSALRRISFENASYVDFLRSLGVRRFSMDALPQGVDVSKVKGLLMDVYYPWVYVTSGRNCHVAGITDPERGRHVKKSPCGMECRRLRIETPEKQAFYSVAKGNAVWMECLNLRAAVGDIDRLVYEPYIPV